MSAETRDGARPASTIYEMLSQAAAAFPRHKAITYLEDADTFDCTSLTYHGFIERLHQMAHLFTELGIRRTDVVSILSPNVTDATIAFFAAETVGIVNPINFLLRPEEVVAMMKAVKSKVLVTIGPEAPDLWKVTGQVGSQVPTLTHVVTIGAAADGAISLGSDLSGRPTIPPPRDLLPSAEDVAAYFHTGGTTGSPKLAVHLHRNQVFSAKSLADYWQFHSESRVLNGLPIFHVAGSLLLGLSPLARGSEVILPTMAGLRNQRVIANYWKLVEKFKVTVGDAIPTTLVSLLDTPLGDADISSIEFFMTGGTYMPPAIARALEERHRISVRQLYGMTETAGLIAASHHSSVANPDSIGEAIAGADIEARELLDGTAIGGAVPAGKSGVLVTRGPHVFPGYLSSSTQPFTHDGWLITGDIGFCGADGRIVVTGRAKDVIIRSGHNIDPAVIEEAAGRHSDVGIPAAVGMPDAYAGEIPVVYLTLAAEAKISSEALMDHLAATVPEPPARPRHVFILEKMPTTAVGKIDKTALRRDATRRAVETALASLPALKSNMPDVLIKEDEGGRLMVTVLVHLPKSNLPVVTAEISECLGRFSFSHEVLGG
jgi:fatty-acyl-CoA synthase